MVGYHSKMANNQRRRTYQRLPVEVRFWRMVHKTEDCWLWTGAKKEWGHGVINSGGRGRAIRVSRLSWSLHYGEIPEGLLVCHKCDNPTCVRPEHLFLGTHADNMTDCKNKGRYDRTKRPRGEGHGMSKLTEQEVRAIRKLFSEHERRPTLKDAASKFGISLQSVHRIVTRKNWAHVID